MFGFLRRNLAWMLLALILSTGLWLVVTIDQNPAESNWFSSIPVEVKDVPTGMALRTDVAPVRVRVSAPRDVWAARALPADRVKATVDAATAGPGVTEIAVLVTVADSRARVEEVDPARVTLRLEPIRKKDVPVRVRVTGGVPVGYEASPAKATPGQVSISGPQGLVDQVAYAVADVSIDGARASISSPYPVSLLDDAGAPVERLALTPEKVVVEVPVSQMLGYKTVPIVPQITGAVAFGYQIVSTMVDPETTTVAGDPRSLAEMNYIQTRAVDVSGASGDVAVSVDPVLPAGVSLVRSQTALVRVLISPVESSKTVEIAPLLKGAGDRQISISPGAVRVTISGPMPVLTRLRPEDVQVSVDATGLIVGTHNVKPTITLPALLKLVSAQPGDLSVTVR